MNVLSLFNGMNTLRQAMENKKIKVDKYYSSEIKPFAIKLTQYHFPDTIQLGDINNWCEWNINWSEIDFIGSGSPCQDLSSAGKQAGIHGNKSKLFFVFVEILNHCRKFNPDVKFLQENVGSANILDVGIISRHLGIYPVKINSSLLTAQLRDRYYWTNVKTKMSLFDAITDIPQPKDKNILLQSVIDSGTAISDKHYCLSERLTEATAYKDMDSDKAQKYISKRLALGMITLILKEDGKYRIVNQNEMEVLQGFPKGYTGILTYKEAGSILGDGWTLPIIEHILSFI